MITDKRIREAALPMQIILDMFGYVVMHYKEADPDFVPPEDDQVTNWICELQSAVDAEYNLHKTNPDKMARASWRIVDAIRNEYFYGRKVNYVIFVVNKLINSLLSCHECDDGTCGNCELNKRWRVTEKAEDHFYKIWPEIAEYLETRQADLIKGSEKSATKMAEKIEKLLQEEYGMYHVRPPSK